MPLSMLTIVMAVAAGLFIMASISVNGIIAFTALTSVIAYIGMQAYKHASPDINFSFEDNRRLIFMEACLITVAVTASSLIALRTFA